MIFYPSALEQLNKLVPTISSINVAVIMHEAIMQLKLPSNLLKWEYFLKIILDFFLKIHSRAGGWPLWLKIMAVRDCFTSRSSVCLQLKSILTKYYHLLAFVDLWKEAAV